MLSRILAGLVMGGVALALIGLLALIVPAHATITISVLYVLSIAALIGTPVTVVRSASAKAAWRELCRADGVISVVLGVISLGLREGSEWPSGWGYEYDLGRVIGPMPPADVLWGYAAYFGGAAIVLGAILFALSYWPFPPHSGGERQAH